MSDSFVLLNSSALINLFPSTLCYSLAVTQTVSLLGYRFSTQEILNFKVKLSLSPIKDHTLSNSKTQPCQGKPMKWGDGGTLYYSVFSKSLPGCIFSIEHLLSPPSLPQNWTILCAQVRPLYTGIRVSLIFIFTLLQLPLTHLSSHQHFFTTHFQNIGIVLRSYVCPQYSLLCLARCSCEMAQNEIKYLIILNQISFDSCNY